MKKYLVLLFIVPFTVRAQSDFLTLIQELNMSFEMPADFKEVPVKDNPDLAYEYAMKHTKADLEVRYSFFPLKKMIADYEESLKDTNRVMINPNALYRSFILMNILNISQLRMGSDPMPDVVDFNEDAVMEEFGCEFGATAFFEVNSTYSEGYKYCSMVYLHKKDVADVCICFLMKKPKEFEKYFSLAFHALRFNEE